MALVLMIFWLRCSGSKTPSYGMLKVSAAFHHLRFLQTTHLLSLIVLLVLSVLTLFAPMEHSQL